MKKLLFLFIFLPLFAWGFQKPAPVTKAVTKPTTSVKNKGKAPVKPSEVKPSKVVIQCVLTDAPANADTIYVYETVNMPAFPLAKAGRRASDGAYIIELPASAPRFYGFGFNSFQVARIIAGDEPSFKVYANAQYLDYARTNSAHNERYFTMQKRAAAFQAQSEKLRSLYYNSSDPTVATDGISVAAQIAALEQAKIKYLDSLKKEDPLVHRAAALRIPPEALNNPDGRKAELDFYGREFFRFAKLEDPMYENIPDIFNGFDSFVRLLQQLEAKDDQQKQYIDAQLSRLKPVDNAHRIALNAVYSVYRAMNHPLFMEYGGRYVDLYRNKSRGEIAALEQEVKRARTLFAGMEAPDLVGMTPDSQTYSLSQMRGKVVLIDFWASWCQPCIREMPTVKEVYEKYRGKGFDILGISLDREASAWKRAIAQHGLPWRHISDLKGWQSAHAASYSVNSIPATVLVDRQGKIIARDLRGEMLKTRLAEVFGE